LLFLTHRGSRLYYGYAFIALPKEHSLTNAKDRYSAPGTKGRVLHSPRIYDLLAWLLLLGRERPFRERLVQLARLEPGQSVLDIGCGTGSLAIAAKRRVGPSGTVEGIDASPEMIARAKKKASQAGLAVAFTDGVVEALPFPDARFDAVLSTLMLHHLPREARQQCAREMRRVATPGGRVLAVDFGRPAGGHKSLMDHFHRHGGVDVDDIVKLLSEAGLKIVESGAVGVRDLNFVLATA
jgi:ubiquinone/menaquinone biosynthesis C-methylase UbiE